MKRLIKLVGIFVLLVFISDVAQAAVRDPVAVLFKAEGSVTYQRPGKQWKKARRNKFLFAGYQVRTGADGSGLITIEKTGETVKIDGNVLVEITEAGLSTKQGGVSETSKPGVLTSALMKKFKKAQAYTTVRRARRDTDASIDAAREFILSKTQPEIVWENSGKAYRYRVKIGNDVYDVPATEKPVVRVKINSFVGSRKLEIDVIKGKETVISLKPYRRRGKDMDHMVFFLTEEKESELKKAISEIQTTYPDNAFMLGGLFDDYEMWVAAMDSYKSYLDENPDEIEMTPYLFKTYRRLMFTDLYIDELAEWNKAMAE